MTKIKPFINKYNWVGINFPWEKDDWKKFEQNNVTVALNTKKGKAYHAYVSKHNSNRGKQVILLIIPNEQKHESKSEGQWHCPAVKKLLALLRRITSKHYGDFNCLNCLHSVRTKNKLESHKRECENKDFCYIIMPSEDVKILEFNQYEKSDKTPFVIYVDKHDVCRGKDCIEKFCKSLRDHTMK